MNLIIGNYGAAFRLGTGWVWSLKNDGRLPVGHVLPGGAPKRLPCHQLSYREALERGPRLSRMCV